MGIPGSYKALTPTVSGQSVYDESSTMMADLGAEIKLGDRVYKYSVAATAALAGDALAAAANTQIVKATAGAGAIAGTSKVVVYGAAAVDAGVFNEGELITQSVSGQGYIYRIKSQPAVSSAGTAVVVLYDPLQVALTAASTLTLVPNANRLSSLITATTPIKGVAACAVSSGNYFWAQTEGVAAVKVTTTVAYGNICAQNTTGGCTVATVSANALYVGIAMAAGTTGDKAAVLLQLR